MKGHDMKYVLTVATIAMISTFLLMSTDEIDKSNLYGGACALKENMTVCEASRPQAGDSCAQGSASTTSCLSKQILNCNNSKNENGTYCNPGIGPFSCSKVHLTCNYISTGVYKWKYTGTSRDDSCGQYHNVGASGADQNCKKKDDKNE